MERPAGADLRTTIEGATGQPPQRIFLVGCPRSGTTLLQSLLAAHPDVSAFTESQFFTVHLNSRGPLHRIGAGLPERIGAFLAENGFAQACAEGISVHPGTRFKGATCRELGKLIVLFDRLATKRGKSCWVEKTPDNLLRLPLLAQAAPDARFVHIVRKPAANMESYAKAAAKWSGRPCSLEDAAKAWKRSFSATWARMGKDPIVLYENVLAEPTATARRLMPLLSLNLEGYDPSRYAEVAESLILPSETWKSGNTRKISPQSRAPSAEAERLAESAGLNALYEDLAAAAIAQQPPE